MEILLWNVAWSLLLWGCHYVKQKVLLIMIYFLVNILVFYTLEFVFTLCHAPILYIGRVPTTIEKLNVIIEMLVIDGYLAWKTSS